MRVRSLVVDGARVHARLLRDGQLNLTALQKHGPRDDERSTSASGRRRDWQLAVDTLRIDGRLFVETRQEQPPVRIVLAIAGGLQWRLSAPAPAFQGRGA